MNGCLCPAKQHDIFIKVITVDQTLSTSWWYLHYSKSVLHTLDWNLYSLCGHYVDRHAGSNIRIFLQSEHIRKINLADDVICRCSVNVVGPARTMTDISGGSHPDQAIYRCCSLNTSCKSHTRAN